MRSTALFSSLFLAHFPASIAQDQFSRNLESFLQKFSMITMQMSRSSVHKSHQKIRGLRDWSMDSRMFPSSRGKRWVAFPALRGGVRTEVCL